MKKLIILMFAALSCMAAYSQNEFLDQCNANIIVNQDTLIYDDVIVVYAQGDTTMQYKTDRNDYFTIRWKGFNNTFNLTNPTRTVTVPLGTYRTDTLFISFKNPNNKVRNGDFENGNAQFQSGLSYAGVSTTLQTNNSGLLWNDGKYAVGENPRYYHSNFYNGTHDGKMFIANGSGVPNTIVYKNTITVTPNTDYAVSFEGANIDNHANNGNIASFQFKIDSNTVGDIFQLNTSVFSWNEYYQIWNSGDNTSSVITILNQNTAISGNDFAIDNVEVHEICQVVKLVTIQNRRFEEVFVEGAICQGDSLEFRGQYFTEEGVYIDTIYSTETCVDTITKLTLFVNPVFETYDTAEVCFGKTYVFNGLTHDKTGDYTYSLQTVDGCDSILHFNFTINPIYDTTYFEGICEGDTYVSEDFNESTAGVYYSHLQTEKGCDSIICLDLTVFPVFDLFYKEQIEDGMIYTDNGFEENQTGIYIHENVSIHGCDSITTLDLFVKKRPLVYMANVFTPTKDENNIFRVIYDDSDPYIGATLFEIYDRWGTKVFETDDINQGWDGTYKNNVCDQGVYVYRLYYYGSDRILREKTGDFMLLR